MIWKFIQLGLSEAAGASSAGQSLVVTASDALPGARIWQTARICVDSYGLNHGELMH